MSFLYDSSLLIQSAKALLLIHLCPYLHIVYFLIEHPDHSDQVTTLAVPLNPLVFPPLIGYNNNDDNNSDNNNDISKDNDLLFLGSQVLPK